MATDAVPFDLLRSLLDELKLRFQAANNPGLPRKAWLLHIPDKGRPPIQAVRLDGYQDYGYLRLKPIIEDAVRLLDRLPGAVQTRLWGRPARETPVELMSDSDSTPVWVMAVVQLMNASGVGPPLRRVQELPLDENPIGFKFPPAAEWYATLPDFAAASVQAVTILQSWLDEESKQTAEAGEQGGKGTVGESSMAEVATNAKQRKPLQRCEWQVYFAHRYAELKSNENLDAPESYRYWCEHGFDPNDSDMKNAELLKDFDPLTKTVDSYESQLSRALRHPDINEPRNALRKHNLKGQKRRNSRKMDDDGN